MESFTSSILYLSPDQNMLDTNNIESLMRFLFRNHRDSREFEGEFEAHASSNTEETPNWKYTESVQFDYANLVKFLLFCFDFFCFKTKMQKS